MAPQRLFLLRFNIIDGILHGSNLLGVFVRNIDIEGFFERHHQFDNIERIGSEIIDKRRSAIDLIFVDSQLFDNDLLNSLLYRHESSKLCANSLILAGTGGHRKYFSGASLGPAVRIGTMRTSYLLPWAVLLSHLPTFAQPDPRIAEALHRVSSEASKLWESAPRFVGVETVSQRAPGQSGRKLPVQDRTREITSFYALGAFKASPEALRELREVVAVNGERTQDPAVARARFRQLLLTGDDAAKRNAIAEFEKTCLAGAAMDFGQLILLFTRPNLAKYSFQFAGAALAGADQAWIVSFEQQSGSESLHILETRGKRLEKLQGQIWVRQGDCLPLRIVLRAERTLGKNLLRDEATVHYGVVSGALLPASLVYRRFVNATLTLESVYRYSDWQP